MIILAIRTDNPHAELYLFDIKSSPREEQPEQKSHFLPGAPPEATIKWRAHRQLAETIHEQITKILNPGTKISKLRNPITDYSARDLVRGKQVFSLDDIDGIVVFKGPGSFTGLRIGLSVGNALAYAENIPIVTTNGEDWLKRGISKLLAGKNDKLATPFYDRPANTSSPKK